MKNDEVQKSPASGPLRGTAGQEGFSITAINPEYYGVDALRSIILRGQCLDVIWMDLIALLIFSGAMIILGIATYRRTLE
jgi:ABC-type multidrug transport system permease subunit